MTPEGSSTAPGSSSTTPRTCRARGGPGRSVLSSPARGAFDLDAERAEVRDSFGRNTFGQSCLLASRLVESGVRLVTVNMFETVFNRVTWDCHGSRPFSTLDDYASTSCCRPSTSRSRPCSTTSIGAGCSSRRWWWRPASSAGPLGSTPRGAAITGRASGAPCSPAAGPAAGPSSAPAILKAASRSTVPSHPRSWSRRCTGASGSTPP